MSVTDSSLTMSFRDCADLTVLNAGLCSWFKNSIENISHNANAIIIDLHLGQNDVTMLITLSNFRGLENEHMLFHQTSAYHFKTPLYLSLICGEADNLKC